MGDIWCQNGGFFRIGRSLMSAFVWILWKYEYHMSVKFDCISFVTVCNAIFSFLTHFLVNNKQLTLAQSLLLPPNPSYLLFSCVEFSQNRQCDCISNCVSSFIYFYRLNFPFLIMGHNGSHFFTFYI